MTYIDHWNSVSHNVKSKRPHDATEQTKCPWIFKPIMINLRLKKYLFISNSLVLVFPKIFHWQVSNFFVFIYAFNVLSILCRKSYSDFDIKFIKSGDWKNVQKHLKGEKKSLFYSPLPNINWICSKIFFVICKDIINNWTISNIAIT